MLTLFSIVLIFIGGILVSLGFRTGAKGQRMGPLALGAVLIVLGLYVMPRG